MEWSVQNVIEFVGAIVLPVGGFVLTLILQGIRNAIKRLEAADMALAARIEEAQKESRQWREEVPEKYARRDEVKEMFQEVRGSLIRLDEKLERVLGNRPQ